MLRVAAVVACAVASLAVESAQAHVRKHNFWTTGEARSIAEIRATPLSGRRCSGLGTGRLVRGERRYRHFACTGWTAPSFAPKRKVHVSYRLHPLGKYRGPRSPAVVTDTKFTALGIP